MRIIVLGAGHVAHALVDALHEEHDVTVIDVDGRRLEALADRFDVRAIEGDGTSKRIVRMSGVQAIIRTTSAAYLEAWREREIDVDFMVSPELETAYAVSALLGIPAARHTDVFADGKVQIVEFDVPPDAAHGALIGRALRDAELPADSKVAGVIRGGRLIVPRGDARILPGDRVVVIGSPDSARAWSRVASGRPQERVNDVVIFGAGRMGTTIAGVLL